MLLDLLPEPCIDTVRLRVPVDSKFLEEFFADHFTTENRIIKKPKGILRPGDLLDFKWEKKQVQYPSSFSNMTMMKSVVTRSCNWARTVDSNTKRLFLSDSIDVEYSAHKWNNKSSAFNNGELSFSYIWEPVAEAFRFFGVDEHSIELMKDSVLLRRLDLSVNMQLAPRKSGLTVSQVMANMLRFKFRRSEIGNSSGNCSFDGNVLRRGNENSLYKIVIYDKEKEFLANFKKNKEATDEEIAFYDLHKDEVKNILRFEVRYTNRFFRQGLKMDNPQGQEPIQKVIDLSAQNWNTLYKETLGPFALKNATFEQNIGLAMLKRQCQTDKRMHLYNFASDCIERGWKVARESIAKPTFYRCKKQLKEIYDWDVTIKSLEEVWTFVDDPDIQKEQLKVCLVPKPLDDIAALFEDWKQQKNKTADQVSKPVYYVNQVCAN